MRTSAALSILALTAALTSPVLGQGVPETPLNDLGSGTYLGFQGGLYPGGSNVHPPGHLTAGLVQSSLVQPLDRDGRPSATGKVVLLSVGMSSPSQEFCSEMGRPPCDAWTFTGQALADAAVNRTTLAIINGARGTQNAEFWTSPTASNYDRVRSVDLLSAGLTEAQVQAAWVKLANGQPTRSLPDPDADAYRLVTQLGNVLRSMKQRYPNLRLAYLSSRSYAGYAVVPLNPEPYAYESGLAVKWVIEAQIRQAATGVVDPRAGDLAPGAAPWLAWGPYLWANGAKPRSDGLAWLPADFESDGTHVSAAGEQKVGAMLLAFFKSDPTTRSWFLGVQPPPVDVRIVPTVASAPGQLGSYFRTSLQSHNPGSAPIAGRFLFHPAGSQGDRDATLYFVLAPGATRSNGDLLATMGVSGSGSLDILVDSGPVPVAVVRVFNDAGDRGTSGTTVDVFTPDEVLKSGDHGVLLVPADLAAFRMNVGVRSLELGAELRVTLRGAGGETRETVTRAYEPTSYVQVSVADFLDGAALEGGESLTIEVTQGSAIVYAATADNRTQDPSVQYARRQ